MKYITEERFLVSSNNKEAIKNYNDNYDRIFGEPEKAECTGFYDDGIMPTSCENREGCGRSGCPASDFGATHDNPSVPAPCGVCGATDHERVEAFGGMVVQGCPQVPPGTAVCVPAMSFPAGEGCCPHCGRELDEHGLCPDL